MLTNHLIEQEELMAYLDGELGTDRASAAATHLEGCQECQRLAADFRDLSQQLTSWHVEQSSPALTNHIAAEMGKYLSQPRGKFAFLARRQAWAWAGGLSVAAFVVAILIQPRSTPQYEKIDFARARNPLPLQIRDSKANTFFDEVRARNPMIARTTQLTIAVKDFAKTRPIVDEILKRHGGYLGQSNISSPVDSGPVLEAMLRVPSDQLDTAMAELKALGRVESESQTGEEITQQYVDLEARLSNARNSEKRLTDLLRERTGKLADVLAVEKEIERVRGEIERMEAERKNFANRVDFATLNIKLFEESRAGLQVPGSLSYRLRNAAVEGYRTTVESVTGAASFLLAYGPSVLFWTSVLFFPVRLVWRRLRHHLLHSL